MTEHVDGGTAEHLEPGSGRRLPRVERTRWSGRRKLVAGVASLAVLGAGAGAVWAWQALMAQGAQPAEALPASTLAYVAVDLDPAGGQKLAALGFLRKFPSLEKRFELTDGSDLRRSVYDGLKSDLECDLGYDDLAPWMGSRFAFALVQQERPQPVLVAQVADHAKAQGGLERLAECSDGELAFALGNDWAVLAESDKVADRVVRDAGAAPLSEDADFQHWTGEAGDPGVATLYAAPDAGPALVAAFEDSPYGVMFIPTGFDPLSMFATSVLPMSFAYDYGSGGDQAVASPSTRAERREMRQMEREFQRLEEMTPAEQEEYFRKQEGAFVESGQGKGAAVPGTAPGQEPVVVDEQPMDLVGEEEFSKPTLPAEQRTALMNFSGLGGVVRFDDGDLELELVSDRIEGTMGNLVAGTAGDDVLGELPADTAAVFGAGFRDGWGAALVQRFAESSMVYGMTPPTDAVAAFEKDTGLTVADLEALGGDSFAVSAGAGFDPDALFYDPAGTKLAARITGNADAVEAALTKVRDRIPAPDEERLQWRRIGDDVVVGADAGYLEELASSSNLTGTGSFRDAVPDGGDAASVFYLNFDAGDWLARSMAASDRADAEPLAGFGYSLQDEGDRERTLLRLTTED
jgi:hypothetical protein